MMNARIPDAFAEFDTAQTAFSFTPQLVAPQWSPGPVTTGSTLGVPPATGIVGMVPDIATGSSATAYASSVQQRGAGSHPVLWAVILFMVGIVLLGTVAHLEVKKRG